MYPTLFTIGDISVSSFSVMVLVAYMVAYVVGEAEFKRKGMNGNLVDLILIAAVIGGLGGAKILFLFQQATLSDLLANPTRYLASGFTFFGGLIGAIILAWFVTQMKRISFLSVMDAATPPLVLAYAVGRIGCFLVGDDYGVPSNLPWAISFPDGAPPTILKVHPTQLYDTLSMFIVFVILWNIRKRDLPLGWMSSVGFIIFGVQRFFMEFLRSTSPSFIPGLSQAQIISFCLVVLGVIMLYKINQNTNQVSEAKTS
jgi:phosphatidylglycerol---prolipoprotein diacylglyceryl transferase